ncbi:MAG: hypothetical protein H0U81_14015 [Pyrinomonadaceae bacterium]|nr:hypothetical protein [Pyrinomonadaceae bacterium]
MKKRTSVCVTLVVLSVALTAQAATWTKWREVIDGRQNAIDFRHAVDTFNYDGQRLIDWQFRNRYAESVKFDYEIHFEVSGGEHKEIGSLTLNRDETRGNRRLGIKVICARIKNLRLL